ELGPGILGQIYDGIQRPLTVLFEKTGPFIKRGLAPAAIDRSKKWHFIPTADTGTNVSGGDVLGTVKETSLITQRIMVPPNQSGKTVLQQALAKSADAQVIVYVGCGERGNEMAEVLETFPTLLDPRTGQPLMNRTTLVANTSNMPIAAREASVYTGITIAEYF